MAGPKGKRIAIASGLLAILVLLTLLSTGLIYQDRLQEWFRRKSNQTNGLIGKRVDISEGKFPVVDFLKFLSDFTGLPFIYDPNDPHILSQEIQIAGNIKEADDLIVVEILKLNGYRVYRERLADGQEVLNLETIKK